MENNLLNFHQIFTGRLFRIPDYQRGYSWGKRQFDDFWTDVVNLPESREHYTGMLSIQRIPASVADDMPAERWLFKKNYVPYYVVDGQQRLTTFSVFIECFVEYMRSLKANEDKKDAEILLLDDSTSLDEIVGHFIKQSNKTDTLNAYLFGYEVDNPSFKYMRHRIFGEPGGGELAESLYTLNLYNAKRFFAENIAHYADANGPDALEDLYSRMTSDMVFMIHDITEEFDVFAAFETMNNRGKPLSNLELLKSRLIYLVTLLGEPSEVEETLRTTINDCWKSVYWQLGRTGKALPDDDFLRDHWLTRYQYSSRRGEDYASFLLEREFVLSNVKQIRHSFEATLVDTVPEDDSDQDDEEHPGEKASSEKSESKRQGYLTAAYIKGYAESLRESAQWWYATQCPESAKDISDGERLWLRRLKRLGIVYFRPLVVASYIAPKGNSEQREQLFAEIERFIFIVFRLSGAYATYNRNNTYALARTVASGSRSVEEATVELYNRIEDYCCPATAYNSSGFHDRVGRLFKTGNKDGFYGWTGLRYFLYEYEEWLVAQNGNAQKIADFFKKHEQDRVSIEHIYPQSASGRQQVKPNKYWKQQFKGYSKEQREALCASLGNLLPLSMSINASLQAESYPEKKQNKIGLDGQLIRRGYCIGSHSENEVATIYKDWSPEAILERGMQLFDFMEKRWGMKFSSEEDKRALLHIDFVE